MQPDFESRETLDPTLPPLAFRSLIRNGRRAGTGSLTSQLGLPANKNARAAAPWVSRLRLWAWGGEAVACADGLTSNVIWKVAAIGPCVIIFQVAKPAME